MWFAFGFITLITFSIFFGYRRLRASWKGIQAETDGISWQYELCKDNYRVTDVLIGIEAPKGYEFSFKHERWYDRLCKAIGLSVEYQVGNAEFDDLVYIVSDDNHLHRQVSANPTIVDAVLRIFRLDAVRHRSKVEALHCSSGRLWLRIDARRGFGEGNVAALGREVVPWMQKISDALSSAPTSGDSKWRDAFVMKAAVTLAISSGLAINGGVHVMRLIWTKIPFTIDSTALLMDALVIGALVIVALVVATVLVLGGSARAHLVLIEILVVGSFGAMATALTELRDANIELDRSAAVTYQARTLEKRVERTRHWRHYYLYVEDWNGEERRRKVEVPSSFYYQVYIGEQLVIRQKPGFLGYRWVEALEKLAPYPY